MLDSFRRKDTPARPTAPQAQSAYGRMQQALATPPEVPQRTATEISPSVPESATAKPADPRLPAAAAEGGSKLIVGADIKLKGVEITDCDTLVVEGRVEAAMDSRVINIAKDGVFIGKVGIDIAEIRGRFDGELTVRKQLVICSTGRVSGKIRYGSVAIEEGGEICGDVAAIADVRTSTSAHREH